MNHRTGTMLMTAALAGALLAGCAGGDKRSGGDDPGLPELDRPLPPVAGVTLDGRIVNNQTFAGRTVLLNTWFFG